jgi:hypothetical protein
MPSRRQTVLSLSAALLLLSLRAEATTYMMVSDANLAAQASAVAEVSVESADISPAKGAPATDYLVSVERVIQGSLPGSSLIVRVPGGLRPNGMGLKIWGAPEFAPGERALLFLAPNRDGSFRILHLMLGAFHEAKDAQGGWLAVRNLSEAQEVRLPGSFSGSADEQGSRDLGKFREWLTDRALGVERKADYFTARQPVRSLAAPATFFLRDGLKMRWFDFDARQSVPWRALSSGQPSVPGGGFNEFKTALNAWNNAANTNIRYSYAGETQDTTGLGGFDGLNTIVFDQDFPEDFSCETGGVLAKGGPWLDASDRGTFKGETFIRIAGGDIATNSGLGCFFERSANPGKAAEELFGHELGHTLGLGHSCGDTASGPCVNRAKNDALMRAFIHGDGRGARLMSDDLEGIQVLYGTGTITPVGHGPAPPANLKATVSGLSIRLDWKDQSSNEKGFRVYRGVGTGALTLLATLAANVKTYTDQSLAASTKYTYLIASFNNKGETRGPQLTRTTAAAKAGGSRTAGTAGN